MKPLHLLHHYETEIFHKGQLHNLEVRVRTSEKPDRKSRVYISTTDEPDMPKPPYSIRGEDKEVDRQWDRYNRLERELAIEALLEAAVHDAKLKDYLPISENPKNGLKFSRKAGCSCGCSPGWVCESTRGKNIWITLTSKEVLAQREAAFKEIKAKNEAEKGTYEI